MCVCVCVCRESVCVCVCRESYVYVSVFPCVGPRHLQIVFGFKKRPEGLSGLLIS